MSIEKIINAQFKRHRIEKHPDIIMLIELCDDCMKAYSSELAARISELEEEVNRLRKTIAVMCNALKDNIEE